MTNEQSKKDLISVLWAGADVLRICSMTSIFIPIALVSEIPNRAVRSLS